MANRRWGMDHLGFQNLTLGPYWNRCGLQLHPQTWEEDSKPLASFHSIEGEFPRLGFVLSNWKGIKHTFCAPITHNNTNQLIRWTRDRELNKYQLVPQVMAWYEEGPLDLSMPRRKDGVEGSVKITTRDIIQVFSEALVKRTGEPAAGSAPRIAVGTRLKHHTYGEVLTNHQVMERLSEAVKSKWSNRPLEGNAKTKPGRPKKSRLIPDL